MNRAAEATKKSRATDHHRCHTSPVARTPSAVLDRRVNAGIARLSRDDAGELLTLQRAAWVSEAIEGDTLAIPALHEDFADIARQLADPGLTIWGLREGGRLIATVRISTPSPGVILLGRLAVVPDLVGQGLGGAMLRFAEARIPPGTTRVELVTGIHSVANHRFYGARGYTLVDAPPPPEGAVIFAKELSP